MEKVASALSPTYVYDCVAIHICIWLSMQDYCCQSLLTCGLSREIPSELPNLDTNFMASSKMLAHHPEALVDVLENVLFVRAFNYM